jgi:hypothetical protein
MNGSFINSGTGTISLMANGTSAGDISISRLISKSDLVAAVRISANNGAVSDAGDRGGVDIWANQGPLILFAAFN